MPKKPNNLMNRTCDTTLLTTITSNNLSLGNVKTLLLQRRALRKFHLIYGQNTRDQSTPEG